MRVLCLFFIFLSACEQSSNRIERKQQEERSKAAVLAVGMPAISKFTEKKTLKMILELRDSEVPTHTYIVSLDNKLTKLCDSFGYGIPYATQYTNPQSYYNNGATLPQSDPNGLFSPASADGTWVLCLDKKTKNVKPVLIEPRIIVSPFEL